MNTAEQELIGLCIALEALDDIANHALLDIRDVASCPGESEVYYKTHVHQQMFLVRLLDFSTESGSESLTGVQGSCLDVLQEACNTRSFDIGGSIGDLSRSVADLGNWLNAPSSLTMWLPTLDIEAKLSLPRRHLLFILGNHVKHNLSRLTRVSRSVAEVLTAQGYPVTPDQVLFALDDFRDHLQEDYFIYYGTWLAELVNNVRWGIQDYLRPTFAQSFARVQGSDWKYEYRYSPDILDEAARRWFWRLMDHVRSGPHIRRFVGARYLKGASCTEEPQMPTGTPERRTDAPSGPSD